MYLQQPQAAMPLQVGDWLVSTIYFLVTSSVFVPLMIHNVIATFNRIEVASDLFILMVWYGVSSTRLLLEATAD